MTNPAEPPPPPPQQPPEPPPVFLPEPGQRPAREREPETLRFDPSQFGTDQAPLPSEAEQPPRKSVPGWVIFAVLAGLLVLSAQEGTPLPFFLGVAGWLFFRHRQRRNRQ